MNTDRNDPTGADDGPGPAGADHLLTATGLDAVLAKTLPAGARVVRVDVRPLGEAQGHASRVDRLAVSYEPPGAGPASLIIKRSLGEPALAADYGRPFARAAAAHRMFAGHEPPIRVARCYHAEVTGDGDTGTLILEDLGDWAPADGLAGLSDAQLESALRAAARLHAWHWGDPETLAAGLRDGDYPTVTAFADHWSQLRPYVLRGARSPAAAAGDAFVAALPTALAWARRRPVTLTHGDYYADNLRLRGERVAVLDWGLAFAGLGAYDTARLAATSAARTPTAESLRWACGVWAAELRACGVPDYPDTVAYADFRLGVALAFPTVLAALVDENDPRRAATAAARSARVRSSLAALGIESPASILPPA